MPEVTEAEEDLSAVGSSNSEVSATTEPDGAVGNEAVVAEHPGQVGQSNYDKLDCAGGGTPTCVDPTV